MPSCMDCSKPLSNPMITFDDFLKLDIRVGRVIHAEPFPEAHKPAYKLTIDFGDDLGIKKSSAQLVANYQSHQLKDKMILAVVNFPPRQVGPFMSEVLILGVPDVNGHTVLVQPDRNVPAGGQIH